MMVHRSRLKSLAVRSVSRVPRRLGVIGIALSAALLGSVIMLTPSCGDAGSSGADGGGKGGGPGVGGADNQGGGSSVNPAGLEISPKNERLVVDPEKTPPTIDYRVTARGKPADAIWSVDRPDLAKIDKEGVLRPTGNGAGTVKVTATVGDSEVSTTVVIEISSEANGPGAETPNPTTPPGPGGFMGVGGEGIGGPVSDEVKKVLDGKPLTDAQLNFLYPYDGTVFPQGMLAPLLMWSGTAPATTQGISIRLKAPGFTFKGYYGRPPRLGAKAAYVRHPIPLDVWERATLSAGGSELELEVVIARDGKAYGPITRKFPIAAGVLQGCVYYQSYFTNFVDNECCAQPNDARFGGATLGIKPGATDPIKVAGFTSDGKEGCRVCHSVSANGTRMIVQHGTDYAMSSDINLKDNYKDTTYGAGTRGKLGWIGMTPDGKLGLGSSMPFEGGANDGAGTRLYDMDTGEAVDAAGLNEFVTHAGLPAFSHDGKHVAFTFTDGPGNEAIGGGDNKKLVMMDFDRPSSTFSGPRLLWEGDYVPLWPSFWPNTKGVAFQVELKAGENGNSGNTRSGGTGELWWSATENGTAARLDRLNGLDAEGRLYLPRNADHPKDNELNYEPTVSPVASGGYAWVVFMSRRMYGNQITTQPYASDPRYADLTKSWSPKKLWVAAIKLDAKPGEDPSYPAFYLPAQEIQASNSRGYWTADACIYVGQM
jgi:hypothetical protein